ncbi:MAG: twin-arginine translocase TatA/TatE family subunit [Chloroflexi bacterium]|nr:MAG: twin-arginine translocase TatA/TatE family subunit [Chloroflexota bacterium]
MPHFGPVELILILVIVVMLFGVGKLPEVFGSVGRGIREFRRNAEVGDEEKTATHVEKTVTTVKTETTEPTHTS